MATRVLRGGRGNPVPEARRAVSGPAPERPDRPLYVIAGEPSERAALVEALLPGRSGAVDRVAWPDTLITWRHAEAWEIGLLLPGHRDPRPVDPHLTTGWPTPRVPRSVAIGCPAELLKHVELMEAPAIAADEPVLGPLIRRAARGATALIYLLPDSRGWQPAEVALLGQLTAAGVPLWVALDRLPRDVDVPALVAARSAEVPGTYVLPVTTDDGRSSLAAGLVTLLLAEPVEPRPGGGRMATGLVSRPGRIRRRLDGAPADGGRPAPIEVAGGDWSEALERAIGQARTGLAAVVAKNLAELRRRCADALPDRTATLAATIDLQLYATALHLTQAWRLSVDEIHRQLLTELVGTPTEEAHVRLAAAQERSASVAQRSTPHTLLVTLTGAVAAVTDEPDAPTREPFAGLDIALTDSGYIHLVGRRPTERKDSLVWLDLATAQVESELRTMIDSELDELQYALSAAATEAVEHGLLLM